MSLPVNPPVSLPESLPMSIVVRVWDPVRPPGLNSSVKSLQYAVK
jgi:hypothetical protein